MGPLSLGIWGDIFGCHFISWLGVQSAGAEECKWSGEDKVWHRIRSDIWKNRSIGLWGRRTREQ